MSLTRSLGWGDRSLVDSLAGRGYDAGQFEDRQFLDEGLDGFVVASVDDGSSDDECDTSVGDGSLDGKRDDVEAGLVGQEPANRRCINIASLFAMKRSAVRCSGA